MILSMVDVSTELSTTKATKQGSVNYPMAIMLLEYYNNNMWIDVCCSIYTGHVACRQLGFYGALDIFSNFSAIG